MEPYACESHSYCITDMDLFSGYIRFSNIVLATGDVKLINAYCSLRCRLHELPDLRIVFKLRMVTFRNAYKENLNHRNTSHPETFNSFILL